ncbi:MAG: hypothetical protein Q9O74_11945 [Planctomycetota bacterium]|nr:hypothetical protein [Planctomycetota bacterium]
MSNHTTARSTSTPQTRTRTKLLLLSAGCIGLVWLAGCGRDADEQSISDASILLTAMNSGSGTPTPEAVANKTYNEVISSLQSLASSDAALAADAAILVAEAQHGLAVQATERAADLLHQAQLSQSSIRAQLRAWQMHSAAADAAASYDAAPELAELDRGTRQRQDQAEAARKQKAEIESEIAGLLGQVTDRMSKSAGLRQQAGTLRLEIARVSETEGLRLTEQIRDLSRQADKIEFRARELKVQADRLNLDLHAAEVEIDKFTRQIELLGQSRSAVQIRAAAAQDHAARARADAQRAAVEIAAKVDTDDTALTPFMESQVAETVQEAVRGFTTSAATARKAVSTRKNSAQLTIGQAQQSLADMQWTHALGLDSYAQLMEELAAASPALPAAAEYASRAQTARQQAADAKQAAFDGYQAAKSAYNGAGASGSARDGLNAVGDRLDRISQVVGKGLVDAATLDSLTGPETNADDSSSQQASEDHDTPHADAGDPAAQLRAALSDTMQSIVDGRLTNAFEFVVPAGDTEAAMLAAIKPMLGASDRLDRATQASFGERFSMWSANDPQMQAAAGMAPSFGPTPADVRDVDVNTLDIRVQGDQAILLTGDNNMPQLNFRRDNGEWKLVFDLGMLGAQVPAGTDPAQMVGQMTPMFEGIAALLDDTTAKVESGDLKSNQAVGATIQAQMMQVIMKAMQPPQPQGGG